MARVVEVSQCYLHAHTLIHEWNEPYLNFADHVANLAVRGHRMANLILKYFKARGSSFSVRACISYVHPRLEYCSVAWNSLLMKNIEEFERVQRRFTKRLPLIKHVTYCQRLSALQLESLELRIVRCDLTFANKLISCGYRSVNPLSSTWKQ